MKIGLISINAHTLVLNFASPLHTYAFQHFLAQHEIDSTIIDYKPVYFGNFDVRHPLDHYLKYPKVKEAEQEEMVSKWSRLYEAREKRYDRIEEFIDRYYKKTDICYTAKSIETEDPGFDCYICVTDIIWKNNPKNGLDRGFFLAADTMKGKKKIAYAASRGATSYKGEREKQFLRYVSDFDAISVREKNLKNYMEDKTGLSIPQVIDPVFLNDRSFYDDLAIDPEEKEYILLYSVMDKVDNLVKMTNEFAKKKNMQVIVLGEEPDDLKLLDVSCKFVYGIGVEEWLGYLKNARYVFTNSFHACCFSIIFQNQFFVGARGGDKLDTLLDLFELSGRRISVAANGLAEDMADIDFEKVEALRKTYVKDSEDFILGAIRKAEESEHTPLVPDANVLIEKLVQERKQEEEQKRLKKEQEELEKQQKKEQEEKAKKSFASRMKRKLKKIMS